MLPGLYGIEAISGSFDLLEIRGCICSSHSVDGLVIGRGPSLTPPDDNNSERELRPTETYRKVTRGLRSDWGADLFTSVESIVGTAARTGVDAYAAILNILCGCHTLVLG